MGDKSTDSVEHDVKGLKTYFLNQLYTTSTGLPHEQVTESLWKIRFNKDFQWLSDHLISGLNHIRQQWKTASRCGWLWQIVLQFWITYWKQTKKKHESCTVTLVAQKLPALTLQYDESLSLLKHLKHFSFFSGIRHGPVHCGYRTVSLQQQQHRSWFHFCSLVQVAIETARQSVDYKAWVTVWTHELLSGGRAMKNFSITA